MELTLINGTKIDLMRSSLFRDFLQKPGNYIDLILDQINQKNIYSSIIDKMSPKHGTAVDLGAYVGLVSLFLSPAFKKIIAVEPNPETYLVLCDLIKTSGIKNIKPLNVAVDAQTGSSFLNVDPANQTSWSMVCSNPAWGYTGTIQPCNVLSMEDLFSQGKLYNIDFLKINIEGSEQQLFLSDSFAAMAQKIHNIYFQIHLVACDTETITTRLNSLGFQLEEITQWNIPEENHRYFTAKKSS